MRLALAVLVLLAAAGCEERAPPWQGQPPGGVVDESKPFLPRPANSSWLGGGGATGAGGGSGTGTGTGTGERGGTVAPAAGGLWVSCAAGFRAGVDPLRDVERLSLMCGPVNGMRALGRPLAGMATSTPERRPFKVRRGACYRVFAVAEAAVEELALSVVSPRGSRVASADATAARVIMIEPERPFCSFADDELTVEVRAARGSGRYALRIYELPTKP
jgi:hypothetical protein